MSYQHGRRGVIFFVPFFESECVSIDAHNNQVFFLHLKKRYHAHCDQMPYQHGVIMRTVFNLFTQIPKQCVNFRVKCKVSFYF